MKEAINFRPVDAHNKFTEVKDPQELFKIQTLLSERVSDLNKEIEDYEGDDVYGIQHELQISLRDLHDVEQEIKRRTDNN